MGRYTLTTGPDLVVATGASRIIAATDTLSTGDIVTAAPGSHAALVLIDGNRFDLAAPQRLTGVTTIRDHSIGDSVITLRAGLNLTLHLGADAATVIGAHDADRVVGGKAGGSATILLGSARESVRAGPGGATVLMDAHTAGAAIAGKGVTTIRLAGRYGDAITLGREVHAVPELDITTPGLGVNLAEAGIATVALSATATTLAIGPRQHLVTDYAGGNRITFTSPGQTLTLPYASLDPYLPSDTLMGFAADDAIDLDMPYSPAERLDYNVATGWLTLSNPISQISQTLQLDPGITQPFAIAADAGLPSGDHGTAIRLAEPLAAPCFAAGTPILTAHGPLPVERLRSGDRLVTAAGVHRRLRWIGHRGVACDRHPRPAEVWPVRIRAGAFAPNLPTTDLRLSPDHALLIAPQALVPVRYLVNGATILIEPTGRIDYYHLELASHDVILAGNLAVESYLDTGNRHQFANAGAAIALHPDFAAARTDRACAPLVTGGPIVRAARAALLARAAALGHATTPNADLHLRADGQRIWGTAARGIWTGWVPPGTRSLSILSRIAAPADADPDSDDYRRLGVAISRLVVRGGNVARSLIATDPDWGSGFYPAEQDPWSAWRWTNGAAALPPALWQDITGAFRLDLHLFRTLAYRCTPAEPDRAAL